ncbi:MAG: hypothetical protein GXO48_00690, partial [Chlorobi bacterium]|nr:hypothetical protein [Chlorobiota bacterium]
EYPELKKIIEEYRERERQMWIKHIENIAKIGPTNVALVDLFTGEINTTRLHNARLVIDEKLLEDVRDKIKFVEEGRFSEKEGEPTLKIIGKVETANVILDPNQYYPYLVKNIADELNITQYEAQALIWKHELKGNKKYHIKIQSGKSIIHKYSKHTIDFLKKELEKLSEDTLQDFLKNLRKEYYNSSIKTKRRKRHNR